MLYTFHTSPVCTDTSSPPRTFFCNIPWSANESALRSGALIDSPRFHIIFVALFFSKTTLRYRPKSNRIRLKFRALLDDKRQSRRCGTGRQTGPSLIVSPVGLIITRERHRRPADKVVVVRTNRAEWTTSRANTSARRRCVCVRAHDNVVVVVVQIIIIVTVEKGRGDY